MEIESEKIIEDQTESNCILGEPYFSQFSKEIFKNKSAIEIHTLNRTFNRIFRFFYPLAVVIHMLQNPQRIGLLLTFLSDILAKRS